MGRADLGLEPLARAPTEMVVAAVLEASRRPAGTGQGPQSRDSPFLLMASGGETKSLGQGRHTTPRSSENSPRSRSLGPVPLDWVETPGSQHHPPTAPLTGETRLPQVGG